jgi:ribose transport system ATP-binding protein
MSNVDFIKFDHIVKRFGDNTVLKDINFSIKKGEIHALIGENGAGKSTLLNILHGVYNEYDGKLIIEGNEVKFKDVHDAIKFGVSKVHQEINLIPELTVAQNITLGSEPKKGLFVDYKKINMDARKVMEKLDCNFKATDLVKDLNAGQMQLVLIAKALYHNARLISFDEPTSSLTDKETKKLFEIIADLKSKGITILYVSHRLDELFKICDKITILRDGTYIKTADVNDITKDELIKNMVGRDVSAYAVRKKERCVQKEVALEVKNLESIGVFEEISFEIRKGEILGFAGLVGAKRTEVMRAMFGADKKNKGDVFLNGKKINTSHPYHSVKNGIGLIPEERKTQGFVKYRTNFENMSLSNLDKFSSAGFIDYRKIKKNAEEYTRKLNINPKDINYLTEGLSGGNQQKVIIGKWLTTDSEVLVLDEPTKGVDVGAKAEIYELIEELVHSGKSIILVSSELPEIIGLCDRVIVMKDGKKMAELNQNELSEETIMKHAMEAN